MRCDACGSGDSLFVVVSGNSQGETRLCRGCALEKGYLSTEGESAMPQMDTILDQLDKPDKPVESGTSCPVCGMDKDQLVVAGSLGCPFCVQTFRHQFLLARKRRGLPAGYAGKVPRSLAASPGSFPGGQDQVPPAESNPADSLLPGTDLEGSRLLADMESAVLAEDFEKAAMLRDRLGSAKNNGYAGNDA